MECVPDGSITTEPVTEVHWALYITPLITLHPWQAAQTILLDD